MSVTPTDPDSWFRPGMRSCTPTILTETGLTRCPSFCESHLSRITPFPFSMENTLYPAHPLSPGTKRRTVGTSPPRDKVSCQCPSIPIFTTDSSFCVGVCSLTIKRHHRLTRYTVVRETVLVLSVTTQEGSRLIEVVDKNYYNSLQGKILQNKKPTVYN